MISTQNQYAHPYAAFSKNIFFPAAVSTRDFLEQKDSIFGSIGQYPKNSIPQTLEAWLDDLFPTGDAEQMAFLGFHDTGLRLLWLFEEAPKIYPSLMKILSEIAHDPEQRLSALSHLYGAFLQTGMGKRRQYSKEELSRLDKEDPDNYPLTLHPLAFSPTSLVWGGGQPGTFPESFFSSYGRFVDWHLKERTNGGGLDMVTGFDRVLEARCGITPYSSAPSLFDQRLIAMDFFLRSSQVARQSLLKTHPLLLSYFARGFEQGFDTPDGCFDGLRMWDIEYRSGSSGYYGSNFAGLSGQSINEMMRESALAAVAETFQNPCSLKEYVHILSAKLKDVLVAALSISRTNSRDFGTSPMQVEGALTAAMGRGYLYESSTFSAVAALSMMKVFSEFDFPSYGFCVDQVESFHDFAGNRLFQALTNPFSYLDFRKEHGLSCNLGDVRTVGNFATEVIRSYSSEALNKEGTLSEALDYGLSDRMLHGGGHWIENRARDSNRPSVTPILAVIEAFHCERVRQDFAEYGDVAEDIIRTVNGWPAPEILTCLASKNAVISALPPPDDGLLRNIWAYIHISELCRLLKGWFRGLEKQGDKNLSVPSVEKEALKISVQDWLRDLPAFFADSSEFYVELYEGNGGGDTLDPFSDRIYDHFIEGKLLNVATACCYADAFVENRSFEI